MTETNFLVGFFHVEGHGKVTFETPLTGHGTADYEKLWAQARSKYPGAHIERTGSTIESRTADGESIHYAPGSTIQQLFLMVDGGDDLCSRHVGRVDFSGQECDVVLHFHRAKNSAGLNLVERASKAAIRFSEGISGMRLASDLPDLVKGIVGNDGRNLNLWLVESR